LRTFGVDDMTALTTVGNPTVTGAIAGISPPRGMLLGVYGARKPIW
jgi:hypothetical protein